MRGSHSDHHQSLVRQLEREVQCESDLIATGKVSGSCLVRCSYFVVRPGQPVLVSLIECCLCDKIISSQCSLQIIFHQAQPG